LPKLRLGALTASVMAAGVNCKAKVSETPPALAESVTVCAEDAADTVAEKLALVAPAGTVTEEGTETAALLLASVTVDPPLGAAALRVMAQASVPDPVIDELEQERPVSTGTPVPLRATVVEVPPDALEASVSWPVATPAIEGSN
jgi:hypothetical protein